MMIPVAKQWWPEAHVPVGNIYLLHSASAVGLPTTTGLLLRNLNEVTIMGI